MHIRRLFLAILSISFFWTIGAVLIIIFPPLVKNVLGANEQVASLFIAIFSIGIAIGSVAINRLLKSEVSARFAPPSVIAMGVFVLLLHFVALDLEQACGPGADDARQLPLQSDGMADDPLPARRRNHRRDVRRAALRLPDDDRAAKRKPRELSPPTTSSIPERWSSAAAWRSASTWRVSDRRRSCCWLRRCASSPRGSAGSSTSPATERSLSRSESKRTGTPRRKSRRTA